MIAHTLNSNLFSDTNGKCGSEIERVGGCSRDKGFSVFGHIHFPWRKSADRNRKYYLLNKIVIGTLCSRIFIYGGVHIYPEQITLRMCCLSLGGTLLPFIQGESVQGIILSQPWPMIHISIQ